MSHCFILVVSKFIYYFAVGFILFYSSEGWGGGRGREVVVFCLWVGLGCVC